MRETTAFFYEMCARKAKNPDMKIAYYLFDEVRYNGKDNSIDKLRYRQDEYACKYSDIIYTMTKVLADSRAEYNKNIHVMGNGADMDLWTIIRIAILSCSSLFLYNIKKTDYQIKKYDRIINHR